MATVEYMPINFEAIARIRAKKWTMQEAADRASDYLNRIGHKTQMTAQRWNDIESGRRADPQFSTVEAVCYAIECSIDEIRNVPRGLKGGAR